MRAPSSPASAPPHVPKRVNHDARLEALRRYDILDTEPEPAFDRIARLAAHLFDAPTALVNFVADERQWFKSAVGFGEDETGLDVSFCVFTIAKGDVLVVEDLAEDPRFADNPYVTEHGARFYAGAPLVTPDDHRIGTLCVLDTEPRSVTQEVQERLSDLSSMVVDELELRREQAEHKRARNDLEQSRELLRHTEELAEVGGWSYDPHADELSWTDQTYRIHGLSPDSAVDVGAALDFYTDESRSVIESHLDAVLDGGGQYDLELDIETADGTLRHVRTIGEAKRVGERITHVRGAIQDITERHRMQRLQDAQTTLFEQIASGASIDTVLGELCRFAEEELGPVSVSILRVENGRLRHVVAPSLPSDYVDAIDGVEIRHSIGTCGTAAASGQEVVTEDIHEDARWEPVRSVAATAGLRSCWSVPIWAEDGDMLGTFAIYGSEPRTPDARERGLVHQMAYVASVAIGRNQREQDLRESEDRWRQLVDGHPGPIHVSVDGKYVYANRATAELLGVESVEALIGRSMIDFIPEDERAAYRDREGRVYDRREEAELIEMRLRRADGTERIVLVRSVPIQYEGEDAAQTMMWDVTERRQREATLERQNDLFAKAQDIASVGAWEYDHRSGEMSLTDEGYRIHGLSPEAELTPDRSLSFYHPDDRDTIREAFVRAVEEGESYDLELRLITDDGEQRWVHTRGEPQDEDGELVRVRGTIQDITERKVSHRRLQRNKKYTDRLLDAVDDLFFALDEEAQFQRWNDRIPEVTGYSDAELGELTALDLVPESEHERVAATIRKALETGRAQIEVPLLRKDGTTIPYEYAGSLVEHPERGLQIVGIGRDISERVRRRNELEEAKEAAEEADRIKSALLSNMNHELRTPLTSIISFSEIIGSEPALAETFATRIHGGGKRLLHTLNTVMDFAELEADAFSPTPRQVDLGTLARSVVHEFSHQIERKALSVEVHELDGAVTASLDEYLMERVLTHLVSNAVKFTEEGGEVSVTVAAADQAVTLRVADTGVGIDPDFLPHVYDQFAQASSGYNRTHEGNGLGLTIVKRMVDRLSGDLSIDSTPNEGTTVTVRIPGGDRSEPEARASGDAGT